MAAMVQVGIYTISIGLGTWVVALHSFPSQVDGEAEWGLHEGLDQRLQKGHCTNNSRLL